jgi:hypothetical protein
MFCKKQPTAAHCGQSRALLRSPLPASLHYAATSGHHVSTPCHGEALAKTDPLASRLQNPTLPHTASADWKQAVSSATVSGRKI